MCAIAAAYSRQACFFFPLFSSAAFHQKPVMVCSQSRRACRLILIASYYILFGSEKIAVAFSHPLTIPQSRTTLLGRNPKTTIIIVRGGAVDVERTTVESEAISRSAVPQPNLEASMTEPKKKSSLSSSSSVAAAVAFLPMSMLTSFGTWYSLSLERRPILTKSATAGVIFALSDYMAQRLEKRPNGEPRSVVLSRLLTSAAVGFFYFGPAAHYWYATIFKILPGTHLVSTLQKAALGQILFGPTFTCIFFATSLWQSGTFSMSNWMRKIQRDLPGAWLAGVGFWPLVDLVSYTFVPPKWIPLFINGCSLIWTTYLVLKSYS